MSPPLQPQQAILNAVNNLKDEINEVSESPEDIVKLLYGACYVMSIDPEEKTSGGLVWHQQMSTSPTILALQLTFKIKALVRKIDAINRLLFKQV